ncbi:hypothetical protein CYLTODRAFT_488376 [Cylindrobasidium torrendii FP15055 ss-10]|uniref:MYND-type domain-containing protein n=1 Tax=Cylindrobasidium torrendii FP15055 ss-10 TaxID=1314674 RepID=A0A0D7BHR6_9AGAR|nr:hypothetical protein CYLTODRAFT_488376 [Cylindrobasidium torrendii FP15055 ss-10]
MSQDSKMVLITFDTMLTGILDVMSSTPLAWPDEPFVDTPPRMARAASICAKMLKLILWESTKDMSLPLSLCTKFSKVRTMAWPYVEFLADYVVVNGLARSQDALDFRLSTQTLVANVIVGFMMQAARECYCGQGVRCAAHDMSLVEGFTRWALRHWFFTVLSGDNPEALEESSDALVLLADVHHNATNQPGFARAVQEQFGDNVQEAVDVVRKHLHNCLEAAVIKDHLVAFPILVLQGGAVHSLLPAIIRGSTVDTAVFAFQQMSKQRNTKELDEPCRRCVTLLMNMVRFRGLAGVLEMLNAKILRAIVTDVKRNRRPMADTAELIISVRPFLWYPSVFKKVAKQCAGLSDVDKASIKLYHPELADALIKFAQSATVLDRRFRTLDSTNLRATCCYEKCSEVCFIQATKTCSACKIPFYCSQNCQKLAWHAYHRGECRSDQEFRKAGLPGYVRMLESAGGRIALQSSKFLGELSQNASVVRAIHASTSQYPLQVIVEPQASNDLLPPGSKWEDAAARILMISTWEEEMKNRRVFEYLDELHPALCRAYIAERRKGTRDVQVFVRVPRGEYEPELAPMILDVAVPTQMVCPRVGCFHL